MQNVLPLSRRKFAKCCAATLIAAQLPGLVCAGIEFKVTKPVTMICPYPPGSLGDATARTLAQGLAELWKVAVIVDTKAGASGMIWAVSVARSKGDGAALLWMLPEALFDAKALKIPIGFDVTTDLQPVALSVVSACIHAVSTKGHFQGTKNWLAMPRLIPAG